MNILFLLAFSHVYQTIFCLNHFIKNYDKLNYDINSPRRTKRSINKSYKVSFSAFNQRFNLKLWPDLSLFNGDLNGLVNENMIPVHGQIIGENLSKVYGTLVDGIFRGVVINDLRNESSKWFVEHSGYYFNKDPGFHSIIYHNDHVLYNKTSCGWNDEQTAHKMKLMSVNQLHSNDNCKKITFLTNISRHKRSVASSKSTQHVCNLYLQSDTFLWNKVMKLPHINNNKILATKEIGSIFTQHVQGAQTIYQNTVFRKFDGSGHVYNGIGFRVDRVRINTTDDCEGLASLNNPFCDANIDVTNFLNLNSYVRHDDFCLAYVFTYRDFSGGTLGLAWVAEPGGSGGVCEKHRMMQEGASNVRKSLNTGIVTLLNYGSYVALKVSQLTFAHEMGHNFGSKHDDDHKDHYECLPPLDDAKGNYIMFASATSGDKENNNKFSVCSKDSIARLLDRVTSGKGNCFLHQEGSFCGNKLTEKGEECDCGYSEKDCQDRCCNPKQSQSPCKLKPKVSCSPTAGECCTDDCHYRPHSHLCRTKGECYKAAYCQGNSSRCPASAQKTDLTKCQDNTRVCKAGECTGSICESVPGWVECSIPRSDDVTAEMMCYVACKQNSTGAGSSASICISTYELEKNSDLRKKYPQLVKELLDLYTYKGIQSKPGAPCDSYRGYCDAFLRCRSVDADGPLARIKNMIFSPKMIHKLRLLITQYWWAVMLIIIGLILFTGLFLKWCSYHTPSYDPKMFGSNKNNKKLLPTNHRSSRHHNSNHNNQQSTAAAHQKSNRNRRQKLHQNSRMKYQNNNNHPNNNIAMRTSPSNQNNISNNHVQPPPQINRQLSNHSNPTSGVPVRPPRIKSSNNRGSNNNNCPSIRPISMVQASAISEVTSRPISMNIESSIHIQELIRAPPIIEPNYPPPAYNELAPLVLLPQHGRGKKGHRIALNHQARRYK